ERRNEQSAPGRGKPEGYIRAARVTGRRRGGKNRSQHEPNGRLAGRQHHKRSYGCGIRACLRGQGARHDACVRARGYGAAQSTRYDRGCAAGRCHHWDDVAGTRLMFAALRSAVHADIDRQIYWAKGQVKRQARYTALMGILAGVAALAELGAVIVGLIALHSWLAMQTGPFVAHGLIGGGLLLLGLALFALAFIRRRPRLAARPPLQIARAAALLGGLRQGSYDKVVTGGEQTLKLATGTLRDGSGSALLGTLALAVAVGLLVGGRLTDHRGVRRTL